MQSTSEKLFGWSEHYAPATYTVKPALRVVYADATAAVSDRVDRKVYTQYRWYGDEHMHLLLDTPDIVYEVIERRNGKVAQYYNHGRYSFLRGDRVVRYRKGDTYHATLEWNLNNANQCQDNKVRKFALDHRTIPALAREANVSELFLAGVIAMLYPGGRIDELAHHFYP